MHNGRYRSDRIENSYFLPSDDNRNDIKVRIFHIKNLSESKMHKIRITRPRNKSTVARPDVP